MTPAKRVWLWAVLVVLGFLAFSTETTVGAGILLLWFGVALGLSGGWVKRLGVGFIVAIFAGAVAIGMYTPSPAVTTASPSPAASTKPATAPVPSAASSTPPPLELLSSRGYESSSGGYYYVEGQVRNATAAALRNVQVVATWYTKDGTFVTSDDAMIEYNPLMPGQTSPFKTITRGNPLMAKFTVEFKQLFGGALAHEAKSKN